MRSWEGEGRVLEKEQAFSLSSLNLGMIFQEFVDFISNTEIEEGRGLEKK